MSRRWEVNCAVNPRTGRLEHVQPYLAPYLARAGWRLLPAERAGHRLIQSQVLQHLAGQVGAVDHRRFRAIPARGLAQTLFRSDAAAIYFARCGCPKKGLIARPYPWETALSRFPASQSGSGWGKIIGAAKER